MKSFYLTDTGKVREHNEDSVIITRNSEDEYLLAVADGMGGHSCGEVASSIVIKYLGHHFVEDFHHLDKDQAITFINDSIEEVNNPPMWLKAQPNLGKTVQWETYHQDVERVRKQQTLSLLCCHRSRHCQPMPFRPHRAGGYSHQEAGIPPGCRSSLGCRHYPLQRGARVQRES